MAWHDDRNGITRNRSPHRTRRHNRALIPRNPVAGGDTKRNLAIRSDLATRNCKQLVPNFTLKRRANHMQRRRKPRLLPRKISIQPSPRTLKHRRSRAICRTYRRHATSTGNRIGACNTFGVFPKKRRAKVLLPLKPKPRQTAAISGKQDFTQRRGKRRRDHRRLLSKLRKHHTANCADNPRRYIRTDSIVQGRAFSLSISTDTESKRPKRCPAKTKVNGFPGSERVKLKPRSIRIF